MEWWAQVHWDHFPERSVDDGDEQPKNIEQHMQHGNNNN